MKSTVVPPAARCGNGCSHDARAHRPLSSGQGWRPVYWLLPYEVVDDYVERRGAYRERHLALARLAKASGQRARRRLRRPGRRCRARVPGRRPLGGRGLRHGRSRTCGRAWSRRGSCGSGRWSWPPTTSRWPTTAAASAAGRSLGLKPPAPPPLLAESCRSGAMTSTGSCEICPQFGGVRPRSPKKPVMPLQLAVVGQLGDVDARPPSARPSGPARCQPKRAKPPLCSSTAVSRAKRWPG